MPAGGAPVEEAVFLTARSARLAGPSGARPRVLPALPAPFRLVERRYAETYTLLRYRAPRPTLLKPAVLGSAARAVVGAPTVLVQR
jgi:hypothetical protein